MSNEEMVDIEVDMTDEQIAMIIENSPVEIMLGSFPVILTAVLDDDGELIRIDMSLKKGEA